MEGDDDEEEEVGGRREGEGGGRNIDGAWRIIMTRLTLARAVGRASRVTARPAPPRVWIKLPGTRCTAFKDAREDVCVCVCIYKYICRTICVYILIRALR